MRDLTVQIPGRKGYGFPLIFPSGRYRFLEGRHREGKQKKEVGERDMGSLLSSHLGGGGTAAAESPAPESSGVNAFHSSQKWQLHFESAKQSNKLVYLMVVDFSAPWCGHCRLFETVFQEMSAKYTDVDFVKIDVEELSDVVREFGVQAMPAFVFLKQGKEVERIVGAKKDELETKILKHREAAPKFAA